MLERYRSKHKLTKVQTQSFGFLAGKGVSKKIALSLVKRRSGRQSTPQDIQKKVSYLESIKISPKIYGVNRIPASFYEKALGFELNQMKAGIKKTVLWPLEDAHASKQLSKLFPGWKGYALLKSQRPSRTLKNLKAAMALGIKPTVKLLHKFSAENISGMNARLPDSLDPIALSRWIETPNPFDSERSLKLRWLVVDAMVARPTLSVKRTWLMRNLHKTEGITPGQFQATVDELVSRGIASKRNGFLTVSRWFRTGTSSLEEHSERIRKTHAKMSDSAKKRWQTAVQ